jgi:hypothetical protein
MMQYYARGSKAAAIAPIVWIGILAVVSVLNAPAANAQAVNPAVDAVDAPTVQSFLADRAATNSGAAKCTLGQTCASTIVEIPQAEQSVIADADAVGSLADNSAAALRKKLLIPELSSRSAGPAPGITAGAPAAFGARFGQAFSGMYYSTRRPGVDEADGAVASGFGLGDPNRAVGLEVNVSAGSIRRFASNGDVGLKLHRNLPGQAAIALGWDAGIRWGQDMTRSTPTVYGVASKAFMLKPSDANNQMPLTVSLGLGNGRFRSLDAAQNDRDTVGVFGSLGLQVLPQASIVSSWTGRDLNLGMSVVPLKSTPLFVNLLASNILGRNDQNSFLAVSLGYGFNYSGLFR